MTVLASFPTETPFAFSRVVVAGPSSTASERAALARLAESWDMADHDVVSPFDVGPETLRTAAQARVVADAILDADVLALTPGWEECGFACAAVFQAEALGLDIVAE
jgi:hypothetical protein